MEYRIRVYEGEKISDYPLTGREQFSIGAGKMDDCRINLAHIGESYISLHKRNGVWLISSRNKGLIRDEKPVQDGDVFVLDKKKRIAVCVMEYHTEATQKFKLTGHERVTIGRSKGCNVVLPGNNVSRQHATIENRGGSWWIFDCQSRNGTYYNQERLTNGRELKDGCTISIGDYAIRYKSDSLMIGNHEDDGIFEEKEDIYPHWFRRSPRLLRELPKDTIDIDNPPMAVTASETDWVSVLTSPLVMLLSLGLMAVITAASAGTMLIFTGPMALAQIFLAVRNSKRNKKKTTEKESLRLEKYNAYLNETEAKIQSLKRKQIVAMQGAYPSLDEILSIVKTRDMRLWSRGERDEDFMQLRLGLGDGPISFTVKGQKNGFTIEEDLLLKRAERIVEDGQTVSNIPITCNLLEDGLLGIVGERKAAIQLINNLIAETAALHSYEDVKVVTLFSKQEAKSFDWVRWLPHSFDDNRESRFIADSAQSADALMRSFEDVLKQRNIETRENETEGFSPFYLFVLTEYEYMEHQAVLKYLLSAGKKLGIGVIFAYDKVEFLPKECSVIVEVSGRSGILYRKESISNKKKFVMDITLESYEILSRSMAPIRLKGGASDTSLPTSVTFLEGYGVRRPEELNVSGWWASGRTDETMAVPIGVKSNGEQFMFDIHERKHGPHGVVAGMTGSGKSETVQSWILSMALKFSPQDVSFVLIDFKGTGLLLPFTKLPHLAGTISDLDSKIQRNLIALQNEMNRREHLFNENGVSNMIAYLRKYRNGEAKDPLSYLFIIIDEYAEFKVQFPDFTTVVESIVARGRTLGIFAILMTQKPAGVVTDKTKGNINFRWCLKVASSADSKEMLHHADAAKITVPGRAYIQVGEDEVYEQIQSYYSGAQYMPDVEDKSVASQKVSVVTRQGRRICYENEIVEKAINDGVSEIYKVVEYLSDFVENSDYRPAEKIWMQKLPGEIYLESIAEHFCFQNGSWSAERPGGLKPVVGMIDAPARQTQYPLSFDFAGDGHISIFGAPGTGKTTMLQSAVMSLMLHYTPEEVNIYLLDFGGWSLGIFKDFPHVGGVVYDNDEMRMEKLVQMIDRKLLDRKSKFSDIGVGSLQAYMDATGEKLPYIVLALDNFAPVLQLYPNLDTFFIRLTREGGNYGIFLLVTANSQMALGFKINQNIKMAVALQMADKSDYQGIVGKTDGLEPENMAGRGLAKGNPPLEFQAALPAMGETESERVARIKQYAEDMKQSWHGACASPIPVMPDAILFDSIQGKGIVIGLSTQHVEPICLPEGRNHFMPVVGTSGSGKSNMIVTMARQVLSKENASVVLFSNRQYQVNWAEHENCRVITKIEGLDRYMEELVPVLQERKTQHDAGEESAFPPIYIFIDDYKKAHAEMDEKTATRIGAVIRLGAGLGVYLTISEDGDAFCRLSEQGEQVCMLMSRENSGILLGGNFQSYSVFSGDLTTQERMQALPEYEGYLLVKGKATRFKAMKAVEQ